MEIRFRDLLVNIAAVGAEQRINGINKTYRERITLYVEKSNFNANSTVYFFWIMMVKMDHSALQPPPRSYQR